MRQLDLFSDADVLLHRGWDRLGALDLEGAAADLAGQERVRPGSAAELGDALEWVRARVPEARPEAGSPALAVCLALREGRTGCPGLDTRPTTRQRLVRAVASRFGALIRAGAVSPSAPLAEGLPWGVFLAWSGDPAGAAALEAWVRSAPDSPLAWLALGDARVAWGAVAAGRAAYREGFGLCPGARWAADDPGLGPARGDIQSTSPWQGLWWAVGLYEAGWFPRYARLAPAELEFRLGRFRRLAETQGGPEAFFAGLALSEPAAGAPTAVRAAVRRILRDLSAEAYEAHLERLGGA